MTRVLFVVGAPGVGKTTYVRTLLEPSSTLIARPKWTVGSHTVAAGHYSGGTFDGADTVPYNGVAMCLDYWDQFLSKKELTIFDGDRFSNRKVLDFFLNHASRPSAEVLLLRASEDVLASRREARGSHQNARWVLGVTTKAERFAAFFPTERRKVLDAT